MVLHCVHLGGRHVDALACCACAGTAQLTANRRRHVVRSLFGDAGAPGFLSALHACGFMMSTDERVALAER